MLQSLYKTDSWFQKSYEELGQLQTCHCSHKNSQNSSCFFWNQELVFFTNVASLCSVMRHNSSLLFHLNCFMLWTKGPHESANFILPFLKPQGQGLFNFASLFSVIEENSSIFLYVKSHILWIKIAKVKFSDY